MSVQTSNTSLPKSVRLLPSTENIDGSKLNDLAPQQLTASSPQTADIALCSLERSNTSPRAVVNSGLLLEKFPGKQTHYLRLFPAVLLLRLNNVQFHPRLRRRIASFPLVPIQLLIYSQSHLDTLTTQLHCCEIGLRCLRQV